jgi:uncharacterized RDD family membrane protein YckC
MPEGQCEGFRSEQDKKAFALKMGILSGALLFSLALSFIAFFFLIITHAVQGDLGMTVKFATGATYWQGKPCWLLSHNEKNRSADSHPPVSLYVDGKKVGSLPFSGNVRLLAGEDKLWLAGLKGAGYWDGVSLTALPMPLGLKGLGIPFLDKGLPAMVGEQTDGKAVLLSLGPAGWSVVRSMPFSCQPKIPRVEASGESDPYQVFREENGQVLWARLGRQEERIRNWETAADFKGYWVASLLEGDPLVFITDRQAHKLFGLLKVKGGWRREWEINATSQDIALASQADGRPVLIIRQPLQRFKAWKLGRGGLAQPLGELGSGLAPTLRFMAGLALFYALVLSLPLILLAAAHFWMKKHGLDLRQLDGQTVRLASLGRRAAASVVDALVAALPFGMILAALGFALARRPAGGDGITLLVALLFGGLALTYLAWMALLCWWTARWGKSPGKILLGITVLSADSLTPPGWGRAILRVVLWMADGQFFSLVGILAMAFTANRQRVADLAAGTVVVDDRVSGAL